MVEVGVFIVLVYVCCIYVEVVDVFDVFGVFYVVKDDGFVVGKGVVVIDDCVVVLVYVDVCLVCGVDV